jgi:hypothetical protein
MPNLWLESLTSQLQIGGLTIPEKSRRFARSIATKMALTTDAARLHAGVDRRGPLPFPLSP